MVPAPSRVLELNTAIHEAAFSNSKPTAPADPPTLWNAIPISSASLLLSALAY